MKNYRIKKVTSKCSTIYYPQEKWLGLFWVNMFGFEPYRDGSYSTLQKAQDAICEHLEKPVVEYLEVDCGDK